MIAYVDTSALVKLLFQEPGSDLALRAWNAADARVASVLVYTEARAALAAARRERRLTPNGATRALRRLDERWVELHRVAATEPLARAGGELAQREGLRGADALHLATALQAARGTELLFLTWDRELAEAASRCGAAVPVPA